jgi:hypothetical protein
VQIFYHFCYHQTSKRMNPAFALECIFNSQRAPRIGALLYG